MTKQTLENIEETNVHGLSGICRIISFKKVLWTNTLSKIALIATVIWSSLVYFTQQSTFKTIIELKTVIIDFVPGILGFTVTGYALMVGFIQAGMLEKISEPLKPDKFSLYQKMSATFAFNILVQASALVIGYTAHFINFFSTDIILFKNVPNWWITIVNFVALPFLVYAFVISLLLVFQIVLNIFSFSQLHHYFINSEKINRS